MSDVTKWMPYVEKWEGGYSNNPSDKGGETNRGITWTTYQWLAPKLGLKTSKDAFLSMTKEDSRKFLLYYWNLSKADKINNQAIAEFVADLFWATPAYAPRFIQTILKSNFDKSILIDGIIGTKTLSTINQLQPKKLFDTLVQARKAQLESFVKANPSQSIFKEGWFNRLDDLYERNKQYLTVGIPILLIFLGIGFFLVYKN